MNEVTITITDEQNNPLNPLYLTDGEVIYIHVDYDHEVYEFSHWLDKYGNRVTFDRAPGYTPEHEIFMTTAVCGQVFRCVIRHKPDNTCGIELAIMLGDITPSDPAAVGTVTQFPVEYNCGESVVLTATPSSCCTEFLKWADGNTHSTRWYTTMAGQHVVLPAIFVERVFDISIYNIDSSNPNNGYVLTDTRSVKCGDTVEITAVPVPQRH